MALRSDLDTSQENKASIDVVVENADHFITEISRLCEHNEIENAITLLKKWDEKEEIDATQIKSCYMITLNAMIQEQKRRGRQKQQQSTTLNEQDIDIIYIPEQAKELLHRMLFVGKKNPHLLPTAEIFHAVIVIWTISPLIKGTSYECHSLIKMLWSLCRGTRQAKKEEGETNVAENVEMFVPMKESYFLAIRSCSAIDRGRKSAKLAESLMNEMESFCKYYPQLTPDREIVNKVM